jgi:hypothetical protein
MPGPIPFHEFKRKMTRLGVVVKQGRKSTHFKLIRKVGGCTLIHGFARNGNEVKGCYIVSSKRALEITDEQFDKA